MKATAVVLMSLVFFSFPFFFFFFYLLFPFFNRFGNIAKGSTGKYSVATSYKGYPIMFHVSTYLPFIANDEQQLERKRHLGNDVLIVVFKEGNHKFDPSCIHSDFNHIFVVIHKLPRPEEINNKTTYR